MSDQRPDQRDDPSGEGRPPVDGPWSARRRRWSRWIAGGVLLAFGAFVLWNVVMVLMLLYRSVGSGSGGPFGP